MARADSFRVLAPTLAVPLAVGLLMLAGSRAEAQASGAEVSVTGTLTEAPPASAPGTYFVLDELDGFAPYTLRSEVVDLGAYVGQVVTAYGTLTPAPEDRSAVLLDVTRVEPIEGRAPFTVAFELAVAGTPPADATFFGFLGYEPIPLRLTDPDGDGVYTATTPPGLIPEATIQPALIVQGTGTRFSQVSGENPGEPTTVVRNFGPLIIDRDQTLRANVSFGRTPRADL